MNSNSSKNSLGKISNISFIISFFILLVTIGSVAAISLRGRPIVVATNLENIPMEIAGFKATEDTFQESVYKELNADITVYRYYRSPDRKQVDLYIGYYGTAKGGRTGHNPAACLPGAGWAIADSSKVRLSGKHYPKDVEVNYILARKDKMEVMILHWYQSAGSKVLATGIQMNIQRFIRRILHNRNDGAFVQVSTLTLDSNKKEAKSLVTFFAQEVLDLLPEYWPVEH